MRAQQLLVLCVFISFYGYLVAQGVTTTIELSTTATQTPTPSASPTTTNVPSKALNAGQIVGIAVNSAVGGSIIIVLLITNRKKYSISNSSNYWKNMSTSPCNSCQPLTKVKNAYAERE
jgi:hypothetical protein